MVDYPNKTSRIWTHSGDIGDIIYSLPTIKACGGGMLHLFDTPGKTAHGMNEAKVKRIAPLLLEQEYIGGVEWNPDAAESSLNGFRDHMRAGSLADAHLATQGLTWEHRVDPWLHVEPIHAFDVIISKSQRYPNHLFPWSTPVAKYSGRVGFVGFKEEHAFFCKVYGKVPFVEAVDFLELAKIIAGSKLFIGNQSSPAAVAHGLKAPMVQVIAPGSSQAHCVFQRMDCILAWDAKIEFPEI